MMTIFWNILVDSEKLIYIFSLINKILCAVIYMHDKYTRKR